MAILKIARLWPLAERPSPERTDASDHDDLAAFGSENSTLPEVPPSTPRIPRPSLPIVAGTVSVASSPTRRRTRASLQWAAIILLSCAGAAAATWAYQTRLVMPPAPSQLTIETTPAGVEVSIGGQVRGRTPISLTMAPGSYSIQLGTGAQQRTVVATLSPGASLVHQVEMSAAPPPLFGSLHVQTDPSRLPVLVDGVQRGLSPLTIGDLTPGEHLVVVGENLRRTVTVKPSETVALILSAAQRQTTSGGWLTVTAPVALQLRQDGKVIGSTDMDRVMLPSGDHTIEFVNEALGYRAQRRVSISDGKTQVIALNIPKGTISINAMPWAEVWLDGQRVGETPIGNLTVAIGAHDIVFRHPEFGERRETVVVGLSQPTRLGIDMRKK